MNEEFEKIKKLRFRDRITTSDINFIQSVYPKHCGELKKNICWQCPNSIREALFDLLRFVEVSEQKIKDENENQVNKLSEPDLARKGVESVHTKHKSKGNKNNTL